MCNPKYTCNTKKSLLSKNQNLTPKNQKMKTKATILICALSISTAAISQDVITFKNGNEKKVKVTEVSPSEVKYKSFDNIEGPIYTDQKSTIFMIKYENGMKDVFNDEVKNEIQPVKQPVEQPTPIVVMEAPKPKAEAPKTPIDDEDMMEQKERSYGGPRMGVTFIDGGAYRNLLVSEGKRNVGFIIGGVPFTLAKQHRKGEERYTVLKAPQSYKAVDKKMASGLNIYKAFADATNTDTFVFDWDANFTIGFLLSLNK